MAALGNLPAKLNKQHYFCSRQFAWKKRAKSINIYVQYIFSFDYKGQQSMQHSIVQSENTTV